MHQSAVRHAAHDAATVVPGTAAKRAPRLWQNDKKKLKKQIRWNQNWWKSRMLQFQNGQIVKSWSFIKLNPQRTMAHLRKFCGQVTTSSEKHVTLPQWKWCYVGMCVSLGIWLVTMAISHYTPDAYSYGIIQLNPVIVYIYNLIHMLPSHFGKYWWWGKQFISCYIYVMRYSPKFST